MGYGLWALDIARSHSDDVTSAMVRFLLLNQEEDGSWQVKSRSKPIQKLFDNDDPHGPDQFISIPATAWASTALALPEPRRRRL